MKKISFMLFTVTLLVTMLLIGSAGVNAAEYGPEKDLTTAITLGAPGNDGGTITMPQGFAGMRITVGPKNILVTQVGRWYTAASNATHGVLICETDGVLLLDYTTITATAEDVDGFVYVTLPTPILLNAGQSYYITSDYWGETDFFYAGSVQTCTEDAMLDGIVILEGSSWGYYKADNTGWGPMDIKYQVELEPTVAPTATTAPTAEATATQAPEANPQTGDAGTNSVWMSTMLTMACICFALLGRKTIKSR